MRHGRADYDRRIQDSEGLIPADEPVFLVRARDPGAIPAVRAYALAAKALGAHSRVVQRAADQADAMENFARNNPIRLAD